MQKIIFFITFLVVLLRGVTAAQNPYESIGKPMPKGKILTLTNGKYPEVIENDTVVRIGSVMFNTVTGEVVAFLTKDTLHTEYSLEPDVVSRWLSPDPLAEKSYTITPYRYGNNNPIIFTDPDGRWEFQINEKDGKKTAVLVAQKGDNLQSLSDHTGIALDKLKGAFSDDAIAKWEEGTQLTNLGSAFSFDGINEALNATKVTGCNCFGSALEFGQTGTVDLNGEISSPIEADKRLIDGFESTNTPKTGDIVRYARKDGQKGIDLNEDGKINSRDEAARKSQDLPDNGSYSGGQQHYSTFLLKNNNGVQVLTKNGYNAPWQIRYEKNLPAIYGTKTALTGDPAPTYTKKK